MANEEGGNQTLKVEPGSGAATGAGIDAGTDKEMTNREPSSGVSGKQETDLSGGAIAGGTLADAERNRQNEGQEKEK